MLMRGGWYIIGKKFAIHVNPVATQRRYLLEEDFEVTRRPHVVRDQRARFQAGFQRFHQRQYEPVKGDNQYLVQHTNGAYLLDDAFYDMGVAPKHSIALARL